MNAAAHTVKGPSDEGTNPVEGLAHGGTTLQPAGSNGAAWKSPWVDFYGV